jgi:hypothetical protein
MYGIRKISKSHANILEPQIIEIETNPNKTFN